MYFVEGVFDAIFIKNGLAIGGIWLTNDQKHLLNNYEHNHVYLLDNQWQDTASMKESIKLLKKDHSVFIWPRNITHKDVNEYVVKEGSNPFKDEDFLVNNTYTGLKGIMHLKFYK
jgi:hypothetical protein